MNHINKIVKEDIEYVLSSDLPWHTFFGKTVLISGANGLLPSYLVDTLLQLNDKKSGDPVKVVGIVRNLEKAKERFSYYGNRADFQLLNQDVCDPVQYSGKVDFIIHAASQASPKYYGVDPVGTLNANVSGTKNLLDLAVRNNVEGFLLFSSGEVYGQTGGEKANISESDYGYIDPTNVRSCYAESKRMAETMCACWGHQFGVPVKIVRPFHTYGPLMRADDGRVFADFVFDIVNNRNIVMKSDGSAKRVFCYISDAIIAFLLVLLKGEVQQAYNVAGSDEISIRQLSTLLIKLFPEKKLKVISELRANDNNYLQSPIKSHKPDISKIKSLGWRMQISLNEGFYRTVRSYL